MSDDQPVSPGKGSFWQGASSVVQTVATKSALTPIQWICGIVALFSGAVILWGPESLAIAAFVLFALGPVDKVDSQIGFAVIQDCFLGGGFGAWGFVGRRVAAHWRAFAG